MTLLLSRLRRILFGVPFGLSSRLRRILRFGVPFGLSSRLRRILRFGVPFGLSSRLRRILRYSFVALPLLLGVASYALWRTNVPLLGAHRPLWPGAPAMLRDHFADAAWGFAVGALVASLWHEGPRAARLAWYGVGFAVCVLVELLQYTHVFPGAFDAIDLAAQAGSFVIGVYAVGGIDRWTSANAVA